jgi:hypothetical protein
LLTADVFAAALETIPADDWSRTWVAGRTIMLNRMSKRVKEVVDKMRLPAVVHLSRSFWDDARNDTEKEKHQFVLWQLTGMSVRYHHTRTVQLYNYRTICRLACRRSSGTVPSAGAP